LDADAPQLLFPPGGPKLVQLMFSEELRSTELASVVHLADRCFATLQPCPQLRWPLQNYIHLSRAGPPAGAKTKRQTGSDRWAMLSHPPSPRHCQMTGLLTQKQCPSEGYPVIIVNVLGGDLGSLMTLPETHSHSHQCSTAIRKGGAESVPVAPSLSHRSRAWPTSPRLDFAS
jgi:hypothetical protein